MKRIALFTLLACVPFCILKAQDIELGTYTMNTNVKNVYYEKESKKVLIEIGGYNETDRNVGMQIEYRYVKDFRNCLQELKMKMLEWDSIALANNVTEITKDMYISKFRYRIVWKGAYFYESKNKREIKWQYIRENGISYAYFIDVYKSSNNEYIDTQAGMLLRLDEIDKLLEVVSEDNLIKRITEEQNKSDLFR